MLPSNDLSHTADESAETSWLQINLSRLDHNLNVVRKMLQQRAQETSGKSPMICAVIKADAYGLGAVPLARRLAAQGVDMLAVYSIRQAQQLVCNAVRSPILVLIPVARLERSDPLYAHANAGLLHLAVHDLKQLSQINRFSRTLGLNIPIHFYYDTGMSRSGLNQQEMVQAITGMPKLPYVRLAGVYTHLATADTDESFAIEQMAQLDQVLDQCRGHLSDHLIVHLANTFATYRGGHFHRDMIRIGLGLYGYGPELLDGGSRISDIEPLKPIVRWMSRVSHVGRYPYGARVGYGSTYRLERESVIGVIPVGYGDGYPFGLSNRAVVCLPDLRDGSDHVSCRVLGQVNMDQIAVDLTDVPDSTAKHLLGTVVELISDDPTSPCALPVLAETANSHCYEMLCRLSSDLYRRYVTDED